MLLLLLSLFTNYELFHRIQAKQADSNKTPLTEQMHKSVHEIDALLRDFQLEIRKDKNVLRSVDREIKDIGLLDYSITPVWWGGSPQTDLTRMNTTIPFPIPAGHFTESTKDPWEKLNLPGIGPNSPSDPLDGVPGHGFDPSYDLDQTPPPFNPFLSSDAPETPFIPSPASLNHPSHPFSAPKPYLNYISFDASYSPGSPTFRLPTKRLLAMPAFRTATAKREMEGVTMSHLYMKVMRDRTEYRPGGKLLTKANRMKSTTQRSSKLKRTLSKAQAWVRNRQWMKTGNPGRIRQGNMRQEPENPVANPPDEGKLTEVEKSPMEQNKNSVANPPDEGKLTEVEKSPMEQNKDSAVAEGSPGLDDKTSVSFSMPGLTDILPSMSIPGLDEASLTTARITNAPTTENILGVDSSTIKLAVTDVLFHQDEHGFLFVSSPATTGVPVSQITTNTIGQILLNAEMFTAVTPTTAPLGYHEMMDTLDEGYLMVFFLELSRLIADKRSEDVAAVIPHAETLYNKLLEQGKLTFFGEYLMEMGMKFSRLFSGSDVSILQQQAKMMNQMLHGRADFLSVEVNSIIDYADMLYEDDDGEELFAALRTFEAYPNVDSNGRDTCLILIESFFKPYSRLRGNDRLRKLIDSVTKVAIKKFGMRRSGGVATPHPRRKNNKHIPYSLRHRLESTRHRKNRRRQQQGDRYKHRRQEYAAEPKLRSMLPITKHQTRFKVITPRQLRSNGYLGMVRPTMDYFKRRLGRPMHPPTGVLQLFPQANGVEYRRQAETSEQDKHHLGASANQQTLGTLKDEVRRIVEESSYSDEEASLKMNLRHALRVNWHKTSTQSLSK